MPGKKRRYLKKISQTASQASDLGVPASLEKQLSSVVERDGVTLLTPRGPRKRRIRIVEELPALDEVQSLDQVCVQQVSASILPSVNRVHEIPVRRGEHLRSAYVVSLQGISLVPSLPSIDERMSVAEVIQDSQLPVGTGASVQVYASVSTDLELDVDPWFVSQQFTPKNFSIAYRTVYGSWDRALSVFRDVWSWVSGLFRRVERVEEQAMERVEESLGIAEVPRFSFARALAGFVALTFLVTLPANAVALYRAVSDQGVSVMTTGQEAVQEAGNAANDASIQGSAEALKRASERFREADSALSEASALAVGLASVIPSRYRSARALLEIGDKTTEAGRLLALGIGKMFSDSQRHLDERLDALDAYARNALVLLSDAASAMSTVDVSTIPEARRSQVAEVGKHLEQSTQAIREFSVLAQLFSQLVGKDHLRTYLLVFQNNTELRPTGGFMGSLAEVTVNKGAITNIRVPPGGTYDIKGQLTARVVAPTPLRLINSHWQFQDANWSPDFPTSANRIRWFWSKAGQPTIDGVIAINASFLEKLLEVTGPIDVPEYHKRIDASNVLLETQKAVEMEYDKVANTPKKFVGDLQARILERMKSFTQDEWLRVFRLVSESLTNKDIQVALFRPEEEAAIEAYGWNGRLKDTLGDSLALIEANIAGQKTDGVITEQVTHGVFIQDDGSIEDDMTLVRTHQGKKGELFRGVRNVSYLRAYVPPGSLLLEASGFQSPSSTLFKPVDETDTPDPAILAVESTEQHLVPGVSVARDGNRTIFGGWMQLDPGETQTIHFRYRLPMTVGDILDRVDASPERPISQQTRGAYTLLLTSQSGKNQRDLNVQIQYPPSWKVDWSRPMISSSTDEGIFVDRGVWDRDRTLSLLFRMIP